MASRHNAFGRLLGTVENDPQALIGAMPMSGVPDLNQLADSLEQDAQYHAENMKQHADRVRKIAQLQPQFDPGGGLNG